LGDTHDAVEIGDIRHQGPTGFPSNRRYLSSGEKATNPARSNWTQESGISGCVRADLQYRDGSITPNVLLAHPNMILRHPLGIAGFIIQEQRNLSLG